MKSRVLLVSFAVASLLAAEETQTSKERQALSGEIGRLPPVAFVVQERLGNPDGVVRYHSRHVVSR
ncbi:MAG: hypothetical protein FJ388_21740 [Verrucomicrobia bacterium]|nr:hypothetical protein [Verrucomicrobiota bacterium]